MESTVSMMSPMTIFYECYKIIVHFMGRLTIIVCVTCMRDAKQKVIAMWVLVTIIAFVRYTCITLSINS